MTLGVLIIGLGAIGMEYDLHLDSAYIMTHARAVKYSDAFHLLGGIDTNAKKRKVFEQHYDAPAFSSLDDALCTITPDLVIVAVPTEAHLSTVQNILSYCKPKAILCEKPLAYTVEQSKKIIAICKDNAVELYVNYMRRSDPGVIEVKRRLLEGEILTPVKGVVWYTKGFIHSGSHFFNLLSFWLGDACASKLIDSREPESKLDACVDAHIKFELGDVYFLSHDEESLAHYSLELLAPNGKLKYEDAGRKISWIEVANDALFPSQRSFSAEIEQIKNQMHRFQYNVLEQIARSLKRQAAFISTGDDATRTLEELISITDRVGK